MPRVYLETWINAPPECCFDLSRDVDQHAGSMVHTHERAVDGVTSGLMALGDSVTWEARHLGIKWRLTSRITELDPPLRFVDEQVRGPFSHFRHVHEFRPVDDGTLMIDDFQYTAPLAWLGRLADRLFLERYMRKLFLTRNAYIKSLAESGET